MREGRLGEEKRELGRAATHPQDRTAFQEGVRVVQERVQGRERHLVRVLVLLEGAPAVRRAGLWLRLVAQVRVHQGVELPLVLVAAAARSPPSRPASAESGPTPDEGRLLLSTMIPDRAHKSRSARPRKIDTSARLRAPEAPRRNPGLLPEAPLLFLMGPDALPKPRRQGAQRVGVSLSPLRSLSRSGLWLGYRIIIPKKRKSKIRFDGRL